jgi:uncharacterized Ntn-hydrolase superfamily protein
MSFPSTFSIAAFDPKTRELGVAAQSKFLAVGAVVPWAQAGIGAIATQAHANTSYGPSGLALLKRRLKPADVVAKLTSDDGEKDRRQIGVVDAKGRSAAFTGSQCYPYAGHHCGKNYSVQGNLLEAESVIRSMSEAFERSGGSLPVRMLAALRAAQREGGDKRGQQSACLLVVREGGGYAGFNDRFMDLRVDDHPQPIEELARLLHLHEMYFTKPRKQDLVKVAGTVAILVEEALRKLGYAGPLQKSLEDFYHNENFEERLIRPMYTDREVLKYLKSKAEGR